jgi:hypothetical protein
MQRYEQAVQQVQQALDYLETAGVVSKDTADNGRIVYRSKRGGLPHDVVSH